MLTVGLTPGFFNKRLFYLVIVEHIKLRLCTIFIYNILAFTIWLRIDTHRTFTNEACEWPRRTLLHSFLSTLQRTGQF